MLHKHFMLIINKQLNNQAKNIILRLSSGISPRGFPIKILYAFLVITIWAACLHQFMFSFNWYFTETLSWQELHTPKNTNLGTVSVCDPVEQSFQGILILDQSREIQEQEKAPTLFASSSSRTNKGYYDSHFQPSTEGFKCKTCGKSYRWKTSLYNHMRLECGKVAQFQCPHCPHRAKLSWNLQKHIRSKHPPMNILYQWLEAFARANILSMTSSVLYTKIVRNGFLICHITLYVILFYVQRL